MSGSRGECRAYCKPVSESPRVIRRVTERVIELHDDDGNDFNELTRILGL